MFLNLPKSPNWKLKKRKWRKMAIETLVCSKKKVLISFKATKVVLFKIHYSCLFNEQSFFQFSSRKLSSTRNKRSSVLNDNIDRINKAIPLPLSSIVRIGIILISFLFMVTQKNRFFKFFVAFLTQS